MRKVILQTPRLLMCQAKKEDFAWLYETIFSNKDVCEFLWGKTLSKKEANEFFVKKFALKSTFGFAPLFEKLSQNLIGYGGILPFAFENLKGFEFGYVLAKAYWHKGYASEIAKAQIAFIQKKFSNTPIFATTHPQNIASQKILQKAGMYLLQKAKMQRGERLIFVL